MIAGRRPPPVDLLAQDCGVDVERFGDLAIDDRLHLVPQRLISGQSTQVVSHGRHHHSRLTEELQPWPTSLNAPAGLPQNTHWDPWTPEPMGFDPSVVEDRAGGSAVATASIRCRFWSAVNPVYPLAAR